MRSFEVEHGPRSTYSIYSVFVLVDRNRRSVHESMTLRYMNGVGFRYSFISILELGEILGTIRFYQSYNR